MSQFRHAANTIELARDIMAVLQPATGTRGAGVVRVTAESDNVYLQRNWALIPIVNGRARPDLLFKVGEGPNVAKYPEGKRKKASADEPDAQSWWTVTSVGTDVDIVSIIGGVRHNLPVGTSFLFDPPPTGILPTATLQSEITSGVDPTHFAGCMSVVHFEQFSYSALEAYRSDLGRLPGVVIVWDGSEPADGTTQSSIDRGRTRVGSATQLFKERFNIFVVSKRGESDHLRRFEGQKLMEDVSGLLTDRQAVDGQIFSSPTGIQIRGRTRVPGNNAAFQQLYVYLVQLSVTGTMKSYDFRTFNPWLRTHAVFETAAENAGGERKTIVDHEFNMQ